MNVEPRSDEGFLVKNINIVTQGGKKTWEDRYAEEPSVIVKVASPRRAYQSEHQK